MEHRQIEFGPPSSARTRRLRVALMSTEAIIELPRPAGQRLEPEVRGDTTGSAIRNHGPREETAGMRTCTMTSDQRATLSVRCASSSAAQKPAQIRRTGTEKQVARMSPSLP